MDTPNAYVITIAEHVFSCCHCRKNARSINNESALEWLTQLHFVQIFNEISNSFAVYFATRHLNSSVDTDMNQALKAFILQVSIPEPVIRLVPRGEQTQIAPH